MNSTNRDILKYVLKGHTKFIIEQITTNYVKDDPDGQFDINFKFELLEYMDIYNICPFMLILDFDFLYPEFIKYVAKNKDELIKSIIQVGDNTFKEYYKKIIDLICKINKGRITFSC